MSAEKSKVGQSGPTFDAMRNLRTPVWVYDIDQGCVAYANNAALHLWNARSESALCARDLSEDMSATVAERLQQYKNDFVERNATFTENWTFYPKGTPVSLTVAYSGYRLPDKRMAMLCEVLNERHEDPETLRRTDALLHADVMVTMYEEDGPPVYFNPAARKSTDSAGRNFRDMFVNPETHDDLMFDVYTKGENRSLARVFTATGQTWHDVSVRQCTDPATGKPGLLVTAFDVTELKTARDQARFLAENDTLTNCHNRIYLNNRLDALVHNGAANGSGLLYFDLDRFKLINDSLGHQVGDQVLKTAAARIQAQLTSSETLARLGGDEFVLLVEGVGCRDKLSMRAEQICAMIRETIQCGETRLQVTTSIGAVLVTDDVTDWGEAMRRADIALYHSKKYGRNRCSIFTSEMGRAASERADLENDLAHAIKTDQFVLHYQPRVNLKTGRVELVEALVRWCHPTRGMIAPDAFIPLCEETGLIEALGALIIVKACKQAREWQKDGLDIGVSINVSPRQFQSDELIETIEHVAQWDQFKTRWIEFEITETVLIGDDETITQRLNTMNALGFRIAVDDFGTGYSNLANISRFPLHCIKIDKCFVDQLPGSQPVVQLIVTLAQQTGSLIVAEGAERAEQVQLLKKLGCEQAQGYFFSKPVPVKELKQTIKQIEDQDPNLAD